MTTLDFAQESLDTERLKARYQEERDKRLRPEGIAQYVGLGDANGGKLDDIFAESNGERAPVIRECDALIIGGGFGGLLSAARLKQAGIEDVCLIDKASDFGGTWYWNRYPGAACDTESFIYMPLLEEIGYMPTQKYVGAPELLEHSRAIGRHYDLYKDTLFQTDVTAARWDEEALRWRITTSRGDEIASRYITLACGLLHQAKLPDIKGVTSFGGKSFHTSRWDYTYTGGDWNGGLEGLRDKRVGIIGTGATAVQCIPHLGKWAKKLYVFQRTPSSVDARDNRPTDQEWAAGLAPGWQKARMDNFTAVVSGEVVEENLVQDGWTDIIGGILLAARKKQLAGETVDDPDTLIQMADYQKMERVRRRIDQIVKDPETAEALKPWYNQFCKRPCFHDDYLPTFNLPNVELVDTNGRGVEAIDEAGVVAVGQHYDLDCLIFATGFEVSTAFTRRIGFDLEGVDGIRLSEKWSNGCETLHGLTSRGFPNCFILSTMQTGQSSNFQHMLDEQAKHLSYLVATATERGYQRIEPSAEAEKSWVETNVRLALARWPFLGQCTPGYYNNEGQLSDSIAKNSPYNKGPVRFLKLLDEWRRAGDLAGLEVR